MPIPDQAHSSHVEKANSYWFQAFGEVRAPEELRRVAVFGAAFAQVHLPQVRGELGLLVLSAGHVLVRGDDLAPRLQAGRGGTFDGRARALAKLAAHLLVEAQAQQFHLHGLDFGGLRRGDRGQQARHRIERAVGIVAGERLLVRPLVADFAQFADQTPFGVAQRLAEDVVPRLPDQFQVRRGIPLGDRLLCVQPVLAKEPERLLHRADLVGVGELPLDERRQPGPQQVHRFAHPFVIAQCHVFIPWSWGDWRALSAGAWPSESPAHHNAGTSGICAPPRQGTSRPPGAAVAALAAGAATHSGALSGRGP
jgi:hypothetical protein